MGRKSHTKQGGLSSLRSKGIIAAMRNWDEIRRRHYVRKATADNHWFDFMPSRVRDYQAQFGDSFCLVVNGSDTREDAYIIPFEVARQVFTDTALDNRGRWVGTIVGSTLTLTPSGNTLNVAAYHNAFQMLDSPAMLPAAVAGTESPPITEAVDDAIETKLHLESDLESFLLADLGQLEKGLTLFEGNGVKGRQLDAGAAGRIDILAKDSRGDFVVIEVKAGEADRQVCGQLQAYMGWVMEHLAFGHQVRGVIVASDFTDRLKLAARVVPSISLKSYSVVFVFVTNRSAQLCSRRKSSVQPLISIRSTPSLQLSLSLRESQVLQEHFSVVRAAFLAL